MIEHTILHLSVAGAGPLEAPDYPSNKNQQNRPIPSSSVFRENGQQNGNKHLSSESICRSSSL